MPAVPITLKINGQMHTDACAPGTSLLSLLRQCGWAGVHRVCESGDCGACTVWVDDKPVHSCLYPAVRSHNHSITTIEGIAAPDGQLSPMQQAFLEKQGFQCGFCTPGMIMSATKLPCQTEADLRLAMRGNLCRCTGYQAIVESVLVGMGGEGVGYRGLEDGQGNQGEQASQRSQGSQGEGSDYGFPTPHSPLPSPQIGQNIPKQDGPDIVTGKPVYHSDWAPPGLLHMKVLRSPHPHARIRRIDVTRARALPGVHLVLTHEDVPRRPYTTAGHAEPVPDPLDHYILDNKVRYIGDRVAAVVAESIAIAQHACQLIDVDYELLPHVTDPLIAMGRIPSPTPILHDEPDSQNIPDAQRNLAGVVAMDIGNVDEGFATADLILEHTYHLPAVQHTHLEPHICTSWLADDTLVVRSSTQVPFHCQRVLAALYDLPRDRVRVYKAKVGGGFGNKQEILCEDLCALATLRTGKPVQWEFTRVEEFTCTNSRHAMTIRLKTGFQADGTPVAMDMEAIANTGAYGNHGQTVLFLTGNESLGMYRCPHKRFRGYAVYTNTMPAGAFRGYGATQGVFALETQLDEAAHKLGLDPLQVRLDHIIRLGDVIAIGHGDEHFNMIGGYAMPDCFAKVMAAMNYTPGSLPVVEGPLKRGVGFAISMQGSGLAKIHTACVNLALQPNGRFLMRSGSVDVGTGSDTTLRQIAAHVLGVTVADIDLVTADTHTTPFDAGSYASATLYISGQATRIAAEKLRDRLQQEGIDYHSPNRVPFPMVEAESEYAAAESTLTFAVQGVEVAVDTETGKVTVLRSVQAIDLGRAINPRICLGQATGGSAMGIGYALMEELRFDPQGKILNPGFRAYRIPTAADMPPMAVLLVESHDPYGPFGAKGVGEITTNCMAPAIANAIAHATGVRLRQLPMTPERVWNALQQSVSVVSG